VCVSLQLDYRSKICSNALCALCVKFHDSLISLGKDWKMWVCSVVFLFLPDYGATYSLQILAKNIKNLPEMNSKFVLHSLKFLFQDMKENIL